jgi:hypothetical protein
MIPFPIPHLHLCALCVPLRPKNSPHPENGRTAPPSPALDLCVVARRAKTYALPSTARKTNHYPANPTSSCRNTTPSSSSTAASGTAMNIAPTSVCRNPAAHGGNTRSRETGPGTFATRTRSATKAGTPSPCGNARHGHPPPEDGSPIPSPAAAALESTALPSLASSRQTKRPPPYPARNAPLEREAARPSHP